MSGNKIRFFLGSNTKRGFTSLFDELRDPKNCKRLYIIKGGPGSGKSSLMRKIAIALECKKHIIEYFHCASDPGSLDGFLDHSIGIAMMDGTAPHIMDPKYPGAYEVIINMADCWDDSVLFEQKNEIIPLSDTISDCHLMAGSYIRSAAALLDINMQLAMPYVRHDNINDFVDNLVENLRDSQSGKVKNRLLSAVSVGEIVFYSETIEELSDTVYVIPDKWGAASNILLSRLHHSASLQNIEQTVCYCSIRTPDKIDHIIFPCAGITVTTANPFHSINSSKNQIVDGLADSIPKGIQEQMSINLNKSKELIGTACEHIKQAKLLHDDLEDFYIKAMDFSKVDVIYKKIINEIA
ncbi:MAG TPA: hypothetical protein GX002_08425 [Clostridiales bacterium]|jgi:hypothetical protein|nr:hypothetical protein [Clostridiales bacterium]